MILQMCSSAYVFLFAGNRVALSPTTNVLPGHPPKPHLYVGAWMTDASVKC